MINKENLPQAVLREDNIMYRIVNWTLHKDYIPDAIYKGLCPLFWLTFVLVMFSPLTLFIKLIINPVCSVACWIWDKVVKLFDLIDKKEYKKIQQKLINEEIRSNYNYAFQLVFKDMAYKSISEQDIKDNLQSLYANCHLMYPESSKFILDLPEQDQYEYLMKNYRILLKLEQEEEIEKQKIANKQLKVRARKEKITQVLPILEIICKSFVYLFAFVCIAAWFYYCLPLILFGLLFLAKSFGQFVIFLTEINYINFMPITIAWMSVLFGIYLISQLKSVQDFFFKISNTEDKETPVKDFFCISLDMVCSVFEWLGDKIVFTIDFIKIIYSNNCPRITIVDKDGNPIEPKDE